VSIAFWCFRNAKRNVYLYLFPGAPRWLLCLDWFVAVQKQQSRADSFDMRLEHADLSTARREIMRLAVSSHRVSLGLLPEMGCVMNITIAAKLFLQRTSVLPCHFSIRCSSFLKRDLQMTTRPVVLILFSEPAALMSEECKVHD
jgi:hypothetical protein